MDADGPAGLDSSSRPLPPPWTPKGAFYRAPQGTPSFLEFASASENASVSKLAGFAVFVDAYVLRTRVVENARVLKTHIFRNAGLKGHFLNACSSTVSLLVPPPTFERIGEKTEKMRARRAEMDREGE